MNVKNDLLDAIMKSMLDDMFSDVTPAMLRTIYPEVEVKDDAPAEPDSFPGGKVTVYSYGDPDGVNVGLGIPASYGLSKRAEASMLMAICKDAIKEFHNQIKAAADISAMKGCRLSDRVLKQWLDEMPRNTGGIDKADSVHVIAVYRYKGTEIFRSMEMQCMPNPNYNPSPTVQPNESVH